MNSLKQQGVINAAIMILVMGMVILVCNFSFGADCLNQLNSRRASLGIYPYRWDAELTRMAEWEAYAQAIRNRMGHMYGVARPASGAGVGMSSRNDPTGRYFQSCFATSRRHHYAGAACRVGSDGRTYYALYVR